MIITIKKHLFSNWVTKSSLKEKIYAPTDPPKSLTIVILVPLKLTKRLKNGISSKITLYMENSPCLSFLPYHLNSAVACPPPPNIVEGEPQQEVEDINEFNMGNFKISSNGMAFPWKKTSGNSNETLGMLKNYLKILNLTHNHPAPLEKGRGNVRESIP